jgi:hypothetical protein
MTAMNKTLDLLPTAADMGIRYAREIEMSPEKKIIYLSIDPEKETEALQEEAKECWLLYTNTPKEIINESTEIIPEA